MKALLLILLPLLSAAEPTPGPVLLSEWEACLGRLEAFETTRRTRVPDALWDAEPGLRAWRRAIPFQRDVLQWTRARLDADGGAPERHLAENGVQGCERFRSRYEARSEAFLLVLASFACLILVLTARVALAMVPATSPGASDDQNDAASSPPRHSSGAR